MIGAVRVRMSVAAALGALALVVAVSAPARAGGSAAEGLSPWWGVSVGSRPTELTPGGTGHLVVWAENRGDAPTSGNVTLGAVVPSGLHVVGVKAVAGVPGSEFDRGPVSCKSSLATVTTVTCTFGESENAEKKIVRHSLPPFEMIEVQIAVSVSAQAGEEEETTVSVTGGGAPRAVSATRRLALGESEAFGFEDFRLVPENKDGSLDTQAGSHPFQLTSVVGLNQRPLDELGRPESAGLAKDIISELPAGMFGNPTPFSQCTDAQFAKKPAREAPVIVNECPADAAVGVATVQFTDANRPFKTSVVPIFNMTPLPGEPARFGFKAVGLISVFLDTAVQTGGSYAVSVGSHDITQLASVVSVRLTFWGVPGDRRHDGQRGWECLYKYGTCVPSTASTPPPFLVMPTACGAFTATLRGDSWASFEHPTQTAATSYALPEQVDGCNHLQFEPSIGTVPDVPDASTSTGLTVGVHVGQEAALNPEGLAESTLKDTTVALPAGVAVNPSGGDGLEGCSEGLVGFTGIEAGGLERALFTPRVPGSHAAIEAGEFASLQPGVNFCSDESKIATATIRTPLLAHPIEGAVYIASQNENPFGSLIALYLIAEDPMSGTLIKLPGEVRLCQAPGETVDGIGCGAAGQLITTFKNTPELPFEDLELHFFGGERAPLATPARCGTYATQAVFSPWSGNEAVHATGTFQITSGPNNTPCPGPSLPFSPSLTAGTLGIQAGALSPLSTTIGRGDGEQNMQSVTVRMPPGVSGLLTGVELCGEPQANQGLCGGNSLIGETTAQAGVGPHPVSVKGGRVYITGPYNGTGSCTPRTAGCAPFGLAIVNPVKAGPFDLEHDTSRPGEYTPACDCIVVRAKIEVDPITAQLTVTTDPSGSHAIPSLIDGVPVQIQKVNVLVNRPGFTFDPTNCENLSITGSISSNEGATSPVSVPFKAHDCATLAFKPGFKVSTTGKNSRATGAGLTVKLAYPKAQFGSQANIHSVKVSLPKLLPSNLKTLQQACPHTTFENNPAGCPAGSIVGHATATTPLLPVPLTGPAYFVSYGGAQFPELVIVLQGYGVTLDLHGETFINEHTNITSSTFHTVPDAPVGTFTLTLPQGKNSALAAPTPLCGKKLVMPTIFTAQNGATIKQNTPIGITNCPKHKTIKHKKTKKGRKASRSTTARRP
jgi:hypothetical protein